VPLEYYFVYIQTKVRGRKANGPAPGGGYDLMVAFDNMITAINAHPCLASSPPPAGQPADGVRTAAHPLPHRLGALPGEFGSGMIKGSHFPDSVPPILDGAAPLYSVSISISPGSSPS
jgi:hypothetical protein